jgi:hypothetical protein
VCVLAQDFLQEQYFPGSNLITGDHVEKKPDFCGANCSSVVLELRLSIPLRTPNSTGAASAEKALRRSTLEQIPLIEILLLEDILG